ncbi:MAG TPA: S49 family peptidase [Rhodocyclaceae bacterium]|nr:S49 family peptidase [Rhodocyclaceae bacterium]HMV53964.1 S49 family peptidase [Rhodocyclaceae bacterium]HNB79022.1 S49 family peptidase [Rhodocyclaceae bacterium]HNH13874.1 S49 family peptidase [Rhodocyclaceae bacterium]HNI00192.1 S49 family peptidase [Rhodocyclaceae bacterium]
MTEPNNEPNWERSVLEKLATEALVEQRRRRRWSIFFRLLTFLYVGVILWMLAGLGDGPQNKLADGRHTALVQLHGVIGPKGDASAENVIPALQSAFEDRGTQGVVLLINSPGGSPVQAGLINDEIRRLRAKHPATPLYAVVEDMCASGGYYVAAAADRIFVDKASIVGSIGVLMDGFGFTGTMEKLGVERRLLTAGENKGFLDPFSPQEPRHLEHAKSLLSDVHKQFIEVVRKGRANRLKETPETFSGLMWTGEQSISMGLADSLGSVDFVAREVVKAERIRDFTQKSNFAERLAKQLGTASGEAMAGLLSQMRLR